MMVHIAILMLLAETEPISWDMLRQIIQTQEWLAYYAITATLVLVAIILAGTWLSNFILHKRAIKKAVEEISSQVRSELKNDLDEFYKNSADLAVNIEKRLTQMSIDIEEKTKKEVHKNIAFLNAEKSRLFALVCEQLKGWAAASEWWSSAIIDYAEVKEDNLLRISVDALINTLGLCTKLDKECKRKLEKCIPSIPLILNAEKEKIKKLLKKTMDGS
ncbi:MAG: hypothetical protein WBB67_02040 [bacterium]